MDTRNKILIKVYDKTGKRVLTETIEITEDQEIDEAILWVDYMKNSFKKALTLDD